MASDVTGVSPQGACPVPYGQQLWILPWSLLQVFGTLGRNYKWESILVSKSFGRNTITNQTSGNLQSPPKPSCIWARDRSESQRMCGRAVVIPQVSVCSHLGATWRVGICPTDFTDPSTCSDLAGTEQVYEMQARVPVGKVLWFCFFVCISYPSLKNSSRGKRRPEPRDPRNRAKKETRHERKTAAPVVGRRAMCPRSGSPNCRSTGPGRVSSLHMWNRAESHLLEVMLKSATC